jgi:predicted nucleotidyltransferase
VQEALKALTQLGIVQTQAIGRAGVHTINEEHAVVGHLRVLVDPISLLTAVVDEVIDSHVHAVLLFGSVARGEATADSDIDLACIASAQWDGRAALEDAVRARLGSRCDVLTFTRAEFVRLAAEGEPVIAEILRDGVALVGGKPRVGRKAS